MYPKFQPHPGAHERSAFIEPRQPRFNKGPRPGPAPEAPKNLASALKVRNFRQLLEVAGEESLAVALDLTLQRVKELAEGVNFSNETTHHIETTLGLSSGFLDKVNPVLTTEDVERLKSAKPMSDLFSEPTLEEPVRTAQVDAAPSPAPELRQEPQISSESQPVKEEIEMGRPRKSAQVATQPAAAPVEAAGNNEEALRETRRLNLQTLTAFPGAKTQLARVTGLSAANISHRLHGNTIFGKDTADFFCKQLGLPEDWFEAPKGAEDIPQTTLEMLTQKGSGGTATPATRAPRKSKTATAEAATVATEGAPAKKRGRPKMVKPADAAPAVSTPAPVAPAPAIATSLGGQAAARAPEQGAPALRAAVPARAAQAQPAQPPAAAAAPAVSSPAAARPQQAATATQPAPAARNPVAEVLAEGEVGAVAEALMRAVASRSRQGTFSESLALKWLMELATL